MLEILEKSPGTVISGVDLTSRERVGALTVGDLKGILLSTFNYMCKSLWESSKTSDKSIPFPDLMDDKFPPGTGLSILTDFPEEKRKQILGEGVHFRIIDKRSGLEYEDEEKIETSDSFKVVFYYDPASASSIQHHFQGNDRFAAGYPGHLRGQIWNKVMNAFSKENYLLDRDPPPGTPAAEAADFIKERPLKGANVSRLGTTFEFSVEYNSIEDLLSDIAIMQSHGFWNYLTFILRSPDASYEECKEKYLPPTATVFKSPNGIGR